MQIVVLLSVGIHYFDFYNPKHKKTRQLFWWVIDRLWQVNFGSQKYFKAPLLRIAQNLRLK